MQPGRLHHTLQAIAKPRLDTAHEKQLFKQSHVLAGGLVIQPDATARLRKVYELA